MELEIAVALVTVFALAVTVISAGSYRRSGSRKVLIITAAFAVFFLKGVVLSAGLMRPDVPWELLILVSIALDAVVAIMLFVAVIAKGSKG